MKYLLRNDVGMQRSGGNGGVPYFGRSLVTAKIGRDENLAGTSSRGVDTTYFSLSARRITLLKGLEGGSSWSMIKKRRLM